MRNPFAAIAVITALTIFFSLTMLPREWTDLLWLLLLRIIRKTLGGPAPLLCDMLPSQRIPDTYVVSLANSYSFEEHKRRTGRAIDLDRAILDVGQVHLILLGDITMYEVKSDDASLINAVRAEIGVLFVQCKGRIYLDSHQISSVQPTPLEEM